MGQLSRAYRPRQKGESFFFFGLSGATLIVLGFLAGIRVVSIISEGGGMATGIALVSILLLTIGVLSVLSVLTGIILNVLIKRKD